MSDDEFDLDFVNQATNKVKTKWTSKIIDKDLKDVTNTLCEEVPVKKKKGKISDFMDRPINVVEKSNEDKGDSDDDEIEVKDHKETSEISLTPPGSPTGSPVATKSARGTRRTKKTEQALKKIQKNQGSTAALRHSQLRDHEPMWRPQTVPGEESFELKVRWKLKIVKVMVKPWDSMKTVTDLVAKEAGVSTNDLHIYKDESTGVPFSLEKTVRELRLSIVSVLSARAKVVIGADGEVDKSGDGGIEIKLQTKDRRAQPVLVRILATDNMQTVIDRFCEQSNTDKEKVKIFFEGDQLNPEELASDLDLEGGECFDVHINEK